MVHVKKCVLRTDSKEERFLPFLWYSSKKKAVRTKKKKKKKRSEERELRMAPWAAGAPASDTYLRAFPRSTGNGKATCWPSPTGCVSHSAVWIILKSPCVIYGVYLQNVFSLSH